VYACTPANDDDDDDGVRIEVYLLAALSTTSRTCSPAREKSGVVSTGGPRRTCLRGVPQDLR